MRNKVIMKVCLIILLLFAFIILLLAVPSPGFDSKIFGSNFENYLMQKYEHSLVDQVFRTASQNYYEDHNAATTAEDPSDEITVNSDQKIIKYDGRDIICSLTAHYKQAEYEIHFKGTKVIGDKYNWKIQDNQLFSILKEDHR